MNDKFKAWIGRQRTLYPEGYKPTHSIKDFLCLPLGEDNISIAGRINKFKVMGKICFIELYSEEASAQVVLSSDITSDFDFFSSNINSGDHIFATGKIIKTNMGRLSLGAENIVMLSKAHYPFSPKWYGISDEEILIRKPYLAVLANKDQRENLRHRLNIINVIKKILIDHRFLEVETPILQNVASGAAATPFKTHYNALDADFYLRISPELFLKTMMVAGYERVFEMGKCFRNEGIDTSHLQEFTMLECYAAYWTYKDHIELAKELILGAVDIVSPNRIIESERGVINFNLPWKQITYRDLMLEKTGIDIYSDITEHELLEYINKEKLLNKDTVVDNKYEMVELIYKKKCCSIQKDPIIITRYPKFICPLAKAEGKELLMFQLVVDGIEIIKSYSELIDPVAQEENFKNTEKEIKNEKKETAEYVRSDDDFIEALKYGLPPMAGLGLGIDRLVKLLTNTKNIRRVLFFAPHKK